MSRQGVLQRPPSTWGPTDADVEYVTVPRRGQDFIELLETISREITPPLRRHMQMVASDAAWRNAETLVEEVDISDGIVFDDC